MRLAALTRVHRNVPLASAARRVAVAVVGAFRVAAVVVVAALHEAVVVLAAGVAGNSIPMF
jgi:hypothetical protein